MVYSCPAYGSQFIMKIRDAKGITSVRMTKGKRKGRRETEMELKINLNVKFVAPCANEGCAKRERHRETETER